MKETVCGDPPSTSTLKDVPERPRNGPGVVPSTLAQGSDIPMATAYAAFIASRTWSLVYGGDPNVTLKPCPFTFKVKVLDPSSSENVEPRERTLALGVAFAW